MRKEKETSNLTLICRFCSSDHVVLDGVTAYGSQRYLCKNCKRRYGGCKFCSSMKIVGFGFTRNGAKRNRCQSCGRTFVSRNAPPGQGSRYPSKVIAIALHQFYEGVSYQKIRWEEIGEEESTWETRSSAPNISTIYRWVTEFTGAAVEKLSSLPLEAGRRWFAFKTEVPLNSNGFKTVNLWDCIDSGTQLVLASRMLEATSDDGLRSMVECAAQRSGALPDVVIANTSDVSLGGMVGVSGRPMTLVHPDYQGFQQYVTELDLLHPLIEVRNNIIQLRAAKPTVEVVLSGWPIHHNFFRPNSALQDRTPAEAAGMDVTFTSWEDVVNAHIAGP